MTQTGYGWIYVLDSQMGYFKIGKAKDLSSRVKALRILLPFRVTVAYAFEHPDCSSAERHLHGRFAHLRLNGEWFSLGIEELMYVRELADRRGLYEMPDGTLRRDESLPFEFPRDPHYVNPDDIESHWDQMREEHGVELWELEEWRLDRKDDGRVYELRQGTEADV
jgi:hypothetical protein